MIRLVPFTESTQLNHQLKRIHKDAPSLYKLVWIDNARCRTLPEEPRIRFCSSSLYQNLGQDLLTPDLDTSTSSMAGGDLIQLANRPSTLTDSEGPRHGHYGGTRTTSHLGQQPHLHQAVPLIQVIICVLDHTSHSVLLVMEPIHDMKFLQKLSLVWLHSHVSLPHTIWVQFS